MSIQTLYTAATGMQALETKLDVIANNLANVSTTGFKKDRANFEDLLYQHDIFPGSEQSNAQTAVGIQVGLGTRVSSTQLNLSQGAIQQTDRTWDIAIEGDGFFKVVDGNNNEFYTRAGNLNVNANGDVVLGSANIGRLIDPGINIPAETNNIRITEQGIITTIQPGQTEATQLGNLTLSYFPNPEGLIKVGDNLYRASDSSGQPVDNQTPGENGVGKLVQGALEASNVEPVRELIDLIQTQRNFELNSQTVQAGDEVMQLISNLRR